MSSPYLSNSDYRLARQARLYEAAEKLGDAPVVDLFEAARPEHLCLDNEWRPGLVADCARCVSDATRHANVIPITATRRLGSSA